MEKEPFKEYIEQGESEKGLRLAHSNRAASSRWI